MAAKSSLGSNFDVQTSAQDRKAASIERPYVMHRNRKSSKRVWQGVLKPAPTKARTVMCVRHGEILPGQKRQQRLSRRYEAAIQPFQDERMRRILVLSRIYWYCLVPVPSYCGSMTAEVTNSSISPDGRAALARAVQLRTEAERLLGVSHLSKPRPSFSPSRTPHHHR